MCTCCILDNRLALHARMPVERHLAASLALLPVTGSMVLLVCQAHIHNICHAAAAAVTYVPRCLLLPVLVCC
jgi:hypothetical protein